MAYPPNPRPWDPTKAKHESCEQSLLSGGEPFALPRIEFLVQQDLQHGVLPNYRLQLKDRYQEPQFSWLPQILMEQKESTSLVPNEPANFAQEILVGQGKIFLDAQGQIVQVNRANEQRLAFTYAQGKVVGITSDHCISFTTDDTNWYYKGDGPPNLPDWKGKVEVTKDGTVTVTKESERDIHRLDGTHTLEKKDNARVDFNPSGKVTEVIAANGRHTSFDYFFTGDMRSMTDPRGTYTTRNGYEWYREKNSPPRSVESDSLSPPAVDWKGTVSFTHNGRVTEQSDSGTSMVWNLDGTKITHYKNGRHLDIDKDGNVTKLVDAKNQITTFKYDPLGKMTEMSDTRGTYTTKDGNDWFRAGNIITALPDWRGSVTVSSSTGLVTEKNANTGAVDRWTLDGRRRTYEPTLPVTEFNERAQALFDIVDKNQSGYLSGAELGKALENPQFTGKNAQVIAALYKCRGDLKNLSHDEFIWETEISRKDLTEFDKLCKLKDKNSIVEKVERFLDRTNTNQRDTLPCSLYRDDAEPLASITHKAISQGTIGDCYLEAVIASIAASSPRKIRDMIDDHGDGTFTITFPGDRSHPITIKAPTEAEMGLNSEASEYGMWANVLEKAFGEYFVENSYFPTKGYSSTEGADGGGLASSSTKLLTGKSVDEYWCSGWRSTKTNQDIKQKLTEAFAEGRAVTCSIGSIGHGQTKDGYTRRHVYSIIGWDPTGKEGGTLTIRNPWGNPTEGPGGTSKMSYQQYLDNFNVVTIEGR
jgi:YD repeat-containing protein